MPVRVNVVSPVLFAIRFGIRSDIVVVYMLFVALIVGRAEFLRITWVVDAISELLKLIIVVSSKSIVVNLIVRMNFYVIVVWGKALAQTLG